MTIAVIHGYFYFIVLPGTNGCVNSCVNSPEDGPVGPKHVEIRRYMNKIEILTSVGFSFDRITLSIPLLPVCVFLACSSVNFTFCCLFM